MGASFYVKWFLLVAISASLLSALYLIASQAERTDDRYRMVNPRFAGIRKYSTNNTDKDNFAEHHSHFQTAKASPLSERGHPPSIHIFYYPWYGNPKYDGGKYYHWNHKYIPHWNKAIAGEFVKGQHVPPPDIASSFYPKLGPYSSRDPVVIEQHMKWISSSGIDVIAISWYPPGMADSEGHSWDDLVPQLLDAAEKHRLKVAFHIEPYNGRNASTLRRDIEYIVKSYGAHPALYKRLRSASKIVADNKKEEPLPLLYFYDSYLVDINQWKMLTTPSGKFSVRGTTYDVIFIGLLVKSEDRYTLTESGFDGIYTYFASEGFTYGSTPSNWPSLTTFCRKNGLLFVPSIGPGYDDTRIRAWNAEHTKNRSDGEYYSRMFQMAHIARADIVSITSFNEWHEGTQIEPAVPFTDNQTGFVYSEYSKGPEQYLHLTLDLIKKYFMAAHHIAPAKIANIV
uniref:Glycoprotein endo-alpha-1,2-mannosidase n=1 Tax=Parascaris univalens TaxID=6257 RepID=A0A915CF32_PARUN